MNDFSSKSSTTPPPTYPFAHSIPFPHLLPPPLQQTLCELSAQNSWLVNEVTSLRSALEDLTKIKDELDRKLTSVAGLCQRLASEKKKKKFRKTIRCPYDECGHKYSSKIALNCHIRTKHNTPSKR